MKIGFDANKLFHGKGGLGNYGRNTLHYLSTYPSNNQYMLYAPTRKHALHYDLNPEIQVKTPPPFYGGLLNSFWERKGIVRQLIKDEVKVFHGLCNKLPDNIEKSPLKSIVTIHDLIFQRYPHFYSEHTLRSLKKQLLHSAHNADMIVAVSQQTKNDLIEFYHISPQKIKVIYQACNPVFFEPKSPDQIEKIRLKYKLPKDFIISVGNIEERKNLMSVLRTLHDKKIEIPLVVVGQPTDYAKQAMRYIAEHRMEKQIIFLYDVKNFELSCLYQMARLSIYASLFEGFGIPIIESLASGTPVITSKGTCLEEAGGPAALYINPGSTEEISEALSRLLSDETLHKDCILSGLDYVQKFKGEKLARELNQLYLSFE